MNAHSAPNAPSGPEPAPTVVIGDDHPMMREGLRRSLEAFGLTVLADIGNGREAVSAVEQHVPDIALLDLWMPIMNGIRATEIIKARHPGVAVTILTFDPNEELHADALRAGATQVLTKDTAAADLATLIVSPPLTRSLSAVTSSAPFRDQLSLTPREVEVLDLIVKGAATTTIATSLYISAKTVKNHLASIYEKLDVCDRTQAVLVALRLGLVSLDGGRGQTDYAPPVPVCR